MSMVFLLWNGRRRNQTRRWGGGLLQLVQLEKMQSALTACADNPAHNRRELLGDACDRLFAHARLNALNSASCQSVKCDRIRQILFHLQWNVPYL
jgi:hypothetical protein